MPLTAAERLVEAQDAMHALMTGVSVVEVRDSNGESIRYSAANRDRLRFYIAELKAEIAGTTASSYRPLRPVWG